MEIVKIIHLCLVSVEINTSRANISKCHMRKNLINGLNSIWTATYMYTRVTLTLLLSRWRDALLRREKIANRVGDGNILPEGWTRYACRDVFTVHPPSRGIARVSSFTPLFRRCDTRGTQSRDSLVRRKRNHDRVESSDTRPTRKWFERVIVACRRAAKLTILSTRRRERSTRLDTAAITRRTFLRQIFHSTITRRKISTR